MAQKLEAIGKTEGSKWDDGSDHDGVSKIYVRGGPQGIQYMEFEYVKSGKPEGGELFGVWNTGFNETFEINHLKNEHLESVEGYYDEASGLFQAFRFKTNFRVSELIGYDKGTKFLLAFNGKFINGFHGYTRRTNIISLGAYFTWIPSTIKMAKGGKGGQLWDDGANHEGITKIHVRGGFDGIQYIKFDYVKSGQHKDGTVHGLSGSGFTETFEIDHLNDEHLEAVRGYYNDASGVIQGLQFKTNVKASDMMGYAKGKWFSLFSKGQKIIGFHGYAEKNLNSLGAHFTTLPLTKSECHGGAGGKDWDDGVFWGIKKVYVRYDITHVRCIKFEYNNGTSVVRRQHGVNTGQEEEFELNYPNELIISMEVTLKTFSPNNTKVTSLVFKTSLERTSPTFGHESGGTKILLEKQGCALVGFHGRSHSNALVAIGAYFNWLPSPPPLTAKKIQAQGGDQGAPWDDGAFNAVTKIYVGQSAYGIAYLKFGYIKDWQIFAGDDHGSKIFDEGVEFVIDFPEEYLIAVEGCYTRLIGTEIEIITMLTFETNLQTVSFGYETPSRFVLEKKGQKILGFHGRGSSMIQQLGVYVGGYIF